MNLLRPTHSSDQAGAQSMSYRGLMGFLLVLMAMLLSGCERPPMESVQSGYRGTGMERPGSSTADRQVRATITPTLGMDIMRRQAGFFRASWRARRSSQASSGQGDCRAHRTPGRG